MTRRIALVYFLVLAALLPPASALASVSYIGGGGTGPGQLDRPTSLAVNGAGELIVAELGNNRIQKLTPDGAHVLSFAAPESWSYDSPMQLAVGLDDDILLARSTTDGNSIRRYSTAGVFEDSWGNGPWGEPAYLNGASGVATDSAGNVYVSSFDFSSSSGTDRIVKFSALGDFVSEWTVRDASDRPRKVAAIGGGGNALAVVTTGDRSAPAELIRYDTAGTVISRAGSTGTPTAKVLPEWASGVAIAADGDAYVAAGSKIQRFGPAGDLLHSLDLNPFAYYGLASYNPDPCVPQPVLSGGPTPAETPNFAGVAIDAAGTVYATDPWNQRIAKIDGRPTPRLVWAPAAQWADKKFPLTGQNITLDASGSTAPFSSIAKYEWDLDGDGTFEVDGGAFPLAFTRYNTAGQRNVKLRVTASNGLDAVTAVDVNVGDSSALFVGGMPSLTGNEVTFDGSRSTFPCGSITKYEWDLDGDGTYERDTGTDPKATWTYHEVGTYPVSLRVTRLGGRVDTVTRTHGVRLKPPPGEIGVTINDGAQFTNNAVVQINPTWPSLTQRIIIANDGGFRGSKTFRIDFTQTWRLNSSGPERLPKTVYVRFDQARDRTYSDDIILDETNPVLTQVDLLDTATGAASASKRRSVRLLVRARDNLSGVNRMQVTAKRKRPGRWRRMRRVSRIRTGADALWVRVRDKAGNKSRWRLAR